MKIIHALTHNAKLTRITEHNFLPNLTPIRDSKGIRYDLYQQNQDLKIDSTIIESI